MPAMKKIRSAALAVLALLATTHAVAETPATPGIRVGIVGDPVHQVALDGRSAREARELYRADPAAFIRRYLDPDEAAEFLCRPEKVPASLTTRQAEWRRPGTR